MIANPQLNLPKGKLGEDLATKYLKGKGYQIISRNFKSRSGEIDLIALYNKTLIFIEVKTRLSQQFGQPYEAVTKWKLKSIITTGQYFSLLHPKLPEKLQIDVVSVRLDHNGKLVNLEHLPNVTG